MLGKLVLREQKCHEDALKSRISDVVRQRIPCHRAHNREGLTAKCGALVTRNNQLMMASGAEVLLAGDISDQCARRDQIRRCLVLQTSVDGRAKFVLDALRNVEPVELSMQQVGQAAYFYKVPLG